VPIIGVEVDFLKKNGVDALSASLTEDGVDFILGSVDVAGPSPVFPSVESNLNSG
jgi:hypothetical protein